MTRNEIGKTIKNLGERMAHLDEKARTAYRKKDYCAWNRYLDSASRLERQVERYLSMYRELAKRCGPILKPEPN